jgi:tetratricopeptide (TPR) repeat protein
MEGSALLKYALDVALENDKPSAALRAYYNLADVLPSMDRYEEAATYDEDGLALARRVGNRNWELSFLGHGYSLFSLGEWDRAVERARDLPEGEWTSLRSAFVCYLTSMVQICVQRGQLEEAGRLVDVLSDMADSAEVQERAVHASSRAAMLFGAGEFEEALRSAEAALGWREVLSISYEGVREAFVTALGAAFAKGDMDKVEDVLGIVGTLPPGEHTQFLDGQWMRFRARLDIRRGETEHVESRFKGAEGAFREISAPFYLAASLLDHGTWLVGEGRTEEAAPLFDEARGIFERLGATPWLERLDAVETSRVGAG